MLAAVVPRCSVFDIQFAYSRYLAAACSITRSLLEASSDVLTGRLENVPKPQSEFSQILSSGIRAS